MNDARDLTISPAAKIFATRLEWELNGFQIARDQLPDKIRSLAQELHLEYSLHFNEQTPRIAVFVTRQEHCLLDLLARQLAGELGGTINLIISNHKTLEPLARQFGIPYFCFPIEPNNKREQELAEIEILRKHNIELVVLAKYMQVLSSDFLKQAPRVINIHHSFLPAFPGANPYHKAFARGVKVIGATAHYVTEDLDEGPIIEQDVSRVTHRDSVQDMIRKGKDLEKMALARAIYLHLQRRVLLRFQ